MATEYIEKQTAKEKLCSMCRWEGTSNCDECEHPIDDIPPADVRPVVRGRWEWNEDNGYYYCSECGAVSPREDQDGEYCDCPNYCPICGADTRGGDAE